jgi:hypothetical protein
VGAGAVGVSALSLRGSDTLKDLTVRLLTSTSGPGALECGGVGEPTTDGVTGSLVYEGTGSGNGQANMLANAQDVAPMSSRMTSAICASSTNKAEGIVFALDGISIVGRDTTNANAAGSCAGSTTGCNTDAPKKGLRSTAAGDATAPPPALTSCTAAQIADWRDVLRLIYFGYDASNLTTQNCSSACRTELANGYAKLFQSSCTVGNSCTQLKHAFRRNDESGTTDVFRGSMGVPAIVQKDNFTPFCNSATTGPAINPTGLIPCTGVPAAGTDPACNPGGGTGGLCDTVATSKTFHFCTRVQCTTDGQCGAGNTAGQCLPANAAGNRLCDLELNTSPQRNIANHNLAGCSTGSDCASGTCSTSSVCTCASDAQCPGTAAGRCAGGLCTPPTGSTPQPSHIIETNAQRGYGNAQTGSSWVDVQDADPIRRTCNFSGGNPLEDVCNRDGRLGLVLPVWDATANGDSTLNVQPVTAADAFPTATCDTGEFFCYPAQPYAKDTAGNSIFDICPDGTDPNAPPTTNVCPPAQCAYPVHVNGTVKDPRCISARGNLPGGVLTGDGRVYNLTVWQQLASGAFTIARYPRSTGQKGIPDSFYGPSGQVAMQGAFFRLHAQTPTISGSGACKAESATDQIGCLVQASWCSMGYAGNSAVNGATVAVNVNNVPPADSCVQNLLKLPAGDAATYRISRQLFLNSVQGFESIDPALNPGESADKKNEYKLAQCYGLNNDGAGPHGSAAGIATAAPPTGFGFVSLGLKADNVTPQNPFCDDTALRSCGALGQTGGGCANNTGAIPTETLPSAP